MPADPKCPICHGNGHVIIDAFNSKRCSCLTNQLFAQKMGMSIFGAKDVKSSILTSKLSTNLYLVYDDKDINSHIKLALKKMGLDAHWIYIDDSNVLQAYLGKVNSAKAENIQELQEYPFMILRLGTVGYKNVALPGILYELVLGRRISNRVTWIVTPRHLNEETCLEYSDELMREVNNYYESNVKGVGRHMKVSNIPSSTEKKPVPTVNTDIISIDDQLDIKPDIKNRSVNASLNDLLRKKLK